MKDLQIVDIEGIPVSVPLAAPVPMGLGTAIKREAVLVKVTTADGIVGWGEAHHTRAPAAIAALLNTTIRDLVLGMDASEIERIWKHVFVNQLMSHGAGSAAVCALSGLDTALWDIKGKALGAPLVELLGGSARPVPAYGGGVALGYQAPERLVDEVAATVAQGYQAVKLRIGEGAAKDLPRVHAVREAFPDLEIFTDANTRFGLDDVARILPGLEAAGVGWLEEPFSPHNTEGYRTVAGWTRIPLAAGENHYLRYEFRDLATEGSVRIVQPDITKCGGETEFRRIAGLASAFGLAINPHTSVTGINMAATIHVIASTPAAHYFEADLARGNSLRDVLCSTPYEVDERGRVAPLNGPGIGVEVDEDFLRAHPLTPGSAFLPSDLELEDA